MSKNIFPHSEIQNLLAVKTNLVCVVGYGLSFEANAPHYFDIQNGIWSKLDKQSLINPFTSARHLEVVSNWFNWRRMYLKATVPSLIFQTLKQMQMKWSLKVATQCVDGLAGIGGINHCSELYGNALKAKCYDNGHEFAAFPYGSNETDSFVACESCGSILFPDVQMFDWNSKKAICDEFFESIKQADLIINIGTRDDLEPFSNAINEFSASIPILIISESGVSFCVENQIYRITQKEMLEIIKTKFVDAEKQFSPEGGRLNQVMECVLKLYE